jgi:hypothetical protein
MVQVSLLIVSKMIKVIVPVKSTIVIMLFVIIFSLSLIGISNAKAQAPLSTQLPQPLTMNQTAKTQQTAFSTYTDSQGRFSISYPSTWKVKPATNRFEPVLVSFVTPILSGLSADLNIAASTTHRIDPEVYTITNAAVYHPGYSIFQEPECVKYKIDGQKACSYIVTTIGSPGARLVILHVNSFVNGHMYSFTFSGHGNTFDKDLPLMEQMLASFKSPP